MKAWARVIGAVSATVLIGGMASPVAAAPGRWHGRTGRRLVKTTAVLPGLARAHYLGPAAAGMRLSLTVALRHPDPAGEASAYAALYNPHSPRFHRFLTPTEYDARFGVAPAVTAATESWLRSGGLRVERASGSGDEVFASGTVGQVAALMHTSFGRYRVGPVAFVANRTAPLVPGNLPLATLLGLNTLDRMWTAADVARVDHGNAPAVRSSRTAATCGSPCQTTLTPQNLWGVYDLPGSDTGQGETAGLFGEGYADAVTANLRVYERQQHLPTVPVRVVHTEQPSNATANGDDTDNIEWYLDSDAITGMAPRLRRLDLYFSKSLFDPDVAASFTAWADDPKGPKQMNASFGECETNPANAVVGPLAQPPFYYGTELGDELEPAAEATLLQANLEGRTLFASAGDTGGSCPAIVLPIIGAGNGVSPQPAPEDNYPCASVHVVCVGGTVVDTPGPDTPKPAARASRESETSWTYTGGGSSGYIAEPKYQQGVSAVDRACLSKPNGTPYPPGTVCRGAPDIAAMSGNVISPSPQTLGAGNSYAYNNDMSPGGEGGTSLSSPLTVGMWSRVQAAAPTAAGLGFANETFYAVGKNAAEYHRDFTDITAAETPAGNFYYTNAPGWDYLSGWGAMDVSHLMNDVDHRLTPTHASAPAAVPLVKSGCPTVRSPANNANNYLDPVSVKDPSLDIRSASLRAVGANLVATISGPHVSTTPATGATGSSFLLLWTQGKTTYFADAATSVTGKVSYTVGDTTGGGYTSTHSIKGSFSHGRITMTVPLADVGHPRAGAVLAYPYAIAVADVSGSTPITNPLGFTEDVATSPADKALVIGRTCASASNSHHGGGTRGHSGSSGSKSGGSAASSAGSGSLAATGASLPLIGLVGLALLATAGLLRRLRH